MNCHQFRKYLFAFADGQIDVKSNCDLLDHLKMCPDCSRVVDQHQAIRSLVVASAARVAIPAGLKERVRKNVGFRDPVGHASILTAPLWKRPVVRVLATAAVVVLGVVGLWRTGVIGGESGALNAHDAMARAHQLVQGIVVQHNKCVNQCDMQVHHLESLPHTRTEAARALTERFGGLFDVAAPDLSGFGYEFESANVCTPGRDVHGASAHVMYVNPSYGSRLSFFSLPRWEAAADVLGDATMKAPFSDGLRQCENQSVVAWNSGSTTYIVTGPVNEDDLVAMVRELGFALEPEDGGGE